MLRINAIITRHILIEVTLIPFKARGINIIWTVRGRVQGHIGQPWIAGIATLDSATRLGRRGCIDHWYEEAGYEILVHPPSEGGTTLGGTSEEAGFRLDLVPQDQVQQTQLGRAQFLERAVRQCLKGVWPTRTVSNNSDQPQGRFRVRSWHQPMKANPGGY